MARLDIPGSLVHIMAHSVEGKELFVDDEDRMEFLSRFEKGLLKCEFQCHTWALMDNHYHLFLRTSHHPMSKLMRGLNGGYARYYNLKHKKRGYLFQGRFKSILCQDQDYAEQLIKYINLNPLRAGMVKSLEKLKDWAWCGHGFILGAPNALGQKFQKREECLRRFGENEQNAIIAYLEFLSKSCQSEDNKAAGHLLITETTEITGSCKGLPAVIGDHEFVKNALETYKGYLNRKHRKADYKIVLKTKVNKICTDFKISQNELMKRGKKNRRSDARAAFCYLAHVVELIPLSVIAEFLGTTISPIAVLVKNGAPSEKATPCMQYS